jgi:hypothetical protein
MARGIWVHVGLLAVASAAALYVWTRDKKTAAAASADVTLWSGRSDDVERVVFEAKGKTTALVAKKDSLGSWYLGTVEPSAQKAPDAGGGAAVKPSTFVSVAQGQKIAAALAPMRALRDIGKVGGDRDVEFGFKEPSGTLTVDVSGKQHRLVVGGPTPGGADRYVRDEASGEIYAVKGEALKSLEAGESTLTERELHDFKDPDVESVHVLARGKKRTVLRRGPENKRIWADPSEPDKADETASNWLSKVDRVRPTEYLAAPAREPEPILRIEYSVKGASGVFLEIGKLAGQALSDAGASPAKPDYFIRTERTRLWAKVAAPSVEQVEQDLDSVLR